MIYGNQSVNVSQAFHVALDMVLAVGCTRCHASKLGYDGKPPGKSKVVPHCFRAAVSSILNKEGFKPNVIEHRLSHQKRNGVRAAYTHQAEYLDERAQMTQWWAVYSAATTLK